MTHLADSSKNAMSGRNSQMIRIYTALSILEGAPQGLTVKELTERLEARDLGASKRTVYRDLEALSAAGFPLFPRGEGDNEATRWVLERHTRINEHFVLSARELIALYLARGVLAPLKDTPFFQDLQSIFAKIEGKLGTQAKNHFTELSSEFHFEPGPRWGLGLDPDLLETVRSSSAEKQLLRVTYASASGGDKRERVLGPHYLYFSKGSLYLVAEDLKDKTVKVFSLARMSNAAMLDEPYSGQTTDPDQFFKSSFGIYRGGTPVHIKLDFAPDIAPYVKERRWHESQSVVAKAGGAIVLSLDVALTPELIQWVTGFGPKVEVLEPQALKEQIVEGAARVLDLYTKKKAA